MKDLKEANVYPGLAAAGLVAGDEVVPITDHNTQHVTCRHVAMSSHSVCHHRKDDKSRKTFSLLWLKFTWQQKKFIDYISIPNQCKRCAQILDIYIYA